jgi:hypothetical protein
VSWLSEISHDQGKVTLFAALVALLVGLTGSSVALIIGWRQGTSSRLAAEAAKASAEAANHTARVAGDRAIATMRLQWVHDLRKILSEYHSVLVSYQSEDYRKVSELGTQLDLIPVFPNEQTSSVCFGMSHRCQQHKVAARQPAEAGA